jgi:hypothetical protein
MPEAQITTSRLRNVDVIGSCNFELSELRALPPSPLAFIVSMTEGCPIGSTGNPAGAIQPTLVFGRYLVQISRSLVEVPFYFVSLQLNGTILNRKSLNKTIYINV